MDIPIDTAFHTDHVVPGTPIDWYLERMRASGVTEEIANRCGLKLTIDDFGSHFVIPYFNVDGLDTTHRRQRNREERMVREAGVSGGNFRGKYTQKKGSKNHVYWPPIYPQRLFFNNPDCPLLVCEGELKAIAAQKATCGNGTPTLVAGVPGTKICAQVREELLSINCVGSGDSRRLVYLCTDWNGRGQARERALDLEYDLKKLFQGLGARVVMLRWSVPDGAGEQKLDDWLVAGGDISQAMRESVEEVGRVDTELAELWDYFNENYCIMHGHYIPLSNPKQKYTVTAFRVMEPSKRLQISAKKFLHPDDVWALQPPDQRNVCDGYIFKPAPLGAEVERYVWEDGHRMLNTAPESTWLAPPWETGVSMTGIAPFVKILRRLCQDNVEWMLDFLAHCAQKPCERGPHIVIFYDSGSTGKSKLFDTLDLVFGRYSGPIGDALASSFNAELEHLVIASWSDPVIHGGQNRDLESALKNFSGDSKLTINHKGGAKYTVKNYGRLLIATNKWISRVDSKERRYTVFGGLEKLPVPEAAEYWKWVNEGGAEKVREFLVCRDISAFNVHAPGPRTSQRIEMELESAPPIEQFLVQSEHLDMKDIWSATELSERYKTITGKYVSDTAIGMMVKRLGFYRPPNPIWIEKYGKAARLMAIRNVEKWAEEGNTEWVAEFLRTEHKGH
jgi:Family of unknown function (DUF5906)